VVDPELADVVEELMSTGVRHIHALAWRDLDDPDAGGSERHADEVFGRWAAAGLDIRLRTSAARGRPHEASRRGYRVVRRGGRLGVFPRAVVGEVFGRHERADALVEIWNGVPWGSPLWWRGRPGIVILHHVHGPMWDQILPGPLAAVGRRLEAQWAPPFYRRTPMVTPSQATRDELLGLGWPPEQVTAVDNGIEEFWAPSGDAPDSRPTVVAVGRLAPVKRFELVIAAALEARVRVPDLQVFLVGEGPERPRLQALVEAAGASTWLQFTGRLDADALRSLYRRAWVVTSASLAEGWGLSLTEAAACGTPAVATDISGHRCSVVAGETGILVPPEGLGAALADVLTRHDERRRLATAALARARTLTWDATATGIARVLLTEVRSRVTARC